MTDDLIVRTFQNSPFVVLPMPYRGNPKREKPNRKKPNREQRSREAIKKPMREATLEYPTCVLRFV